VTASVPGPVPLFDHRRYVPVLLTRQGERLALRELDSATRSGATPLFVVHPIQSDPETGLPVRSAEQHVVKLAKQLADDWGIEPAFVDLRHVDTASPLPDGSHPLVRLVIACQDWGLPLTPVVSGAHDPAYRAAAVRAAGLAGTAVGIRLGPSEWPEIGTPLGDGHLLGLLAETGQDPEQTHLILDLEDQVSTTVAVAAAALRPALRALPRAYDWASVTVAGTGMPTGTAEIGRDGAADIPRSEWALWRSMDAPDYRRPSFGDYGVQHPDPLSGFDPRYMDSSAQLRYTTAANWFVVRGRGVKKTGLAQIRDLASQVVAHPEYPGPCFSWGDRWLDECARHTCKAGNQGLWRKVTTNHHLTYVVGQLATLLGP